MEGLQNALMLNRTCNVHVHERLEKQIAELVPTLDDLKVSKNTGKHWKTPKNIEEHWKISANIRASSESGRVLSNVRPPFVLDL